ncbi:hypothetical protein BUQ74_00750 [Leptospira weilii serovar Heyan]|nr:hypothetical protein BUQ74_00750 [Leptospira weilii serovar Heyan]
MFLWDTLFVNLFLKCGNCNKSRFYVQILKVGTPTFRKFFLIFNRRTHVIYMKFEDPKSFL